MNVALTQKLIIDKVKSLEDPFLLEAIESLLSFSVNKEKFKLTDEQKKKIEDSRSQFLNGEYSDQNAYFSELRLWLKEK